MNTLPFFINDPMFSHREVYPLGFRLTPSQIFTPFGGIVFALQWLPIRLRPYTAVNSVW
jgi:hypothetical protein